VNPPSNGTTAVPWWFSPVWLRTTLLYALAAGALAAGISLVLPKTYRSAGKILPNYSGSAASSLLNLAAASGFGDMLSGDLSNVENPVVTYPEILTSTNILERVAFSSYPPSSTNPSNTVMKAIRVRGDDRRSLDRAVRLLRTITAVDANPRTGVISVSAVTRDSVLSAYIVQRMLSELDHFNVESRSSRGRATREFVEARLAEAKKALASSEQSLAAFRQGNIRVTGSAQLQLEQARLEREVESRSELYRLLAREYESARIEEKRDTPTFTVVDPPRPPVRKYQPKTTVNALVALFAAIGVRAFLARFDELRRRRGTYLQELATKYPHREIPAGA
jgi:uncharacterized protein involved in exopolysaccharide biosynthesis